MASNRYLGFWESAFRPREPIPRSYWWGYMLLLNVIPVTLLLVLAASVIEVVDLLFGLDASVIQKAVLLLGPDAFAVVVLVSYVLGIIATIQRLRDLGESPWNVLWLFVPFVKAARRLSRKTPHQQERPPQTGVFPHQGKGGSALGAELRLMAQIIGGDRRRAQQRQQTHDLRDSLQNTSHDLTCDAVAEVPSIR